MIAHLIKWSVANRFLVLLATLFTMAWGIWSVKTTPIDALPDLSDVQVIIRTAYPGQAPQIVENQVTYPLATTMLSVPGAKTVRGFSFFGDSFVYVIFEDGTDLYWARSRVLEYLSQVQSRLPATAKPALGPDATGVGWIYQYALVDRTGKHDLAQLRALQDWFLKYELKTLPNVAEVATVGGMVKQYQVVLDPVKLASFGVTHDAAIAAIRAANQETGGAVLELAETEFMVRASGYLTSVADFRAIPLKLAGTTPVSLGDVAHIQLGPEMRRGIAELDGEGEAVGHGRWQYGIEPEVALTSKGREQFKRFDAKIGELHATGRFAIPHALGQIDPKLEALGFPAWLKANGFDAQELMWYLDYSTRDDYGMSLNDTSAWAGLHYFAARDHDDKGPFTWPEGNGWLLKQLQAKVGRYVRAGEPVYKVQRQNGAWRVMTPKATYLAQSVIWAAPSFLASHIVEGAPRAEGFSYSAWVTANLTLDRTPKAAQTAELAWDNVIYGSPSLGYVVATHQSVAMHREQSVWTWYYAVAEKSPDAARRMLLEQPWEYWRDAALADLAKAHPDIADCVSRIDVFRNGHAMARPTPGFLQSAGRQKMLAGHDGLYYANSDLSGISIFEEAQYRGVEAARRALERLGAASRVLRSPRR